MRKSETAKMRIAHVCAALLLCAGLVAGQSPLNTWDRSNWVNPFGTGAVNLPPNVWVSGVPIRIDHVAGSPQYFEFWLNIDSTAGGSTTSPSVVGFIVTGKDSAAASLAPELAKSDMDTVFFISQAVPWKSYKLHHIKVLVPPGDWMKYVMMNTEADTVVIAGATTQQWMKH